MVEIKVNVQVDLSEKTIEALKGLFVPMPYYPYSPVACGVDTQNGCGPVNISEEEQKAKQSAAAPAPKPEPAAAPTPAQKPEPAKPAAAPAPKPAVKPSSIGIEDVRKILATKVNDHRNEIKEKLNELGAPSVTKLAPEKYQEMYDYLNSL